MDEERRGRPENRRSTGDRYRIGTRHPVPGTGTRYDRAMPLYRWDEIALEKVTEMVSRKVVRGEREMLTQVYLKKGALVPLHAHEEEQMTYVLQGALQFLVGAEDVRVEEGEVLHIPSGVAHQAVALDDTFVLGVFSPVRGGMRPQRMQNASRTSERLTPTRTIPKAQG